MLNSLQGTRVSQFDRCRCFYPKTTKKVCLQLVSGEPYFVIAFLEAVLESWQVFDNNYFPFSQHRNLQSMNVNQNHIHDVMLLFNKGLVLLDWIFHSLDLNMFTEFLNMQTVWHSKQQCKQIEFFFNLLFFKIHQILYLDCNKFTPITLLLAYLQCNSTKQKEENICTHVMIYSRILIS